MQELRRKIKSEIGVGIPEELAELKTDNVVSAFLDYVHRNIINREEYRKLRTDEFYSKMYKEHKK